MGIRGARRLIREGREVSDPAWRVLLARFLAAIRVRKMVRLKSHAAIGVPITWGLLRPVILLPPGHQDWTDDQRSTALLHELGHVKRADYLVLFLVRLSLALFWFNPLCWIVFRRIKQEQERACDELVLGTGIRPSTYADTLLFFKRAAGCRDHVSAAFPGLFGSSSFPERLAAILRQKLTCKEVTMKTKLMLAVAAILAVSLIGLARPSAARLETPLPTILQSPATPATAVSPDGPPAIAAPGREQDKKVEPARVQARKPVKQTRTVIVTDKEGQKIPIEIITHVNAAGKIKVEKALVLKKDTAGEVILVGADGKEWRVLQGDPVRVKVARGTRVETVELSQLAVASDKAGMRVRLVANRPVLRIAKELAVAVRQQTDEQASPSRIRLEKAAGVKAKLSEPTEEPLQTKEQQTEKTELKTVIARFRAELKAKIGKPVVKAVPREKDLTLAVIRAKRADSVDRKIYVVRNAGADVMAAWIEGGTSFCIAFGAGSGEGNRQTFERVLARVKQELPAGHVVEPEFNEKTGDVTLTITGPESQPVSADQIKKVTEVIRAAIVAKD